MLMSFDMVSVKFGIIT